MRLAKVAAVLLVALFAVVSTGRAQTATGEVNGTITDKSGAAVSDAAIKLTNQGTQIAREAQTNSNGYFVFINAQPGVYILKVEKQGFKAANITAFSIDVNQSLAQNIQLDLGEITETVTVTMGWFGVENGTNGGAVVESFFNKSLTYGPCAYDIPQYVTAALTYDLPFGRGKNHLNHGPLSWALGNWKTNLVFPCAIRPELRTGRSRRSREHFGWIEGTGRQWLRDKLQPAESYRRSTLGHLPQRGNSGNGAVLVQSIGVCHSRRHVRQLWRWGPAGSNLLQRGFLVDQELPLSRIQKSSDSRGSV